MVQLRGFHSTFNFHFRFTLHLQNTLKMVERKNCGYVSTRITWWTIRMVKTILSKLKRQTITLRRKNRKKEELTNPERRTANLVGISCEIPSILFFNFSWHTVTFFINHFFISKFWLKLSVLQDLKCWELKYDLL